MHMEDTGLQTFPPNIDSTDTNWQSPESFKNNPVQGNGTEGRIIVNSQTLCLA